MTSSLLEGEALLPPRNLLENQQFETDEIDEAVEEVKEIPVLTSTTRRSSAASATMRAAMEETEGFSQHVFFEQEEYDS